MPRTSCPSSTNKRGQFAQSAEQDERKRPGDRRQLRAPEAGAVGEIDEHVGEVLHGQPVQRHGHVAECGRLADPAQRDRRPRPDVVDVGLGRLADLVLPVRLGVDGRRGCWRSSPRCSGAAARSGTLPCWRTARRRCASRCGRAGRCRRRWCRDIRAHRSMRPARRATGHGTRRRSADCACAPLSSAVVISPPETLALAWYQAVPYYTYLRYIVVPGKRLGVIHP